jgi:hypothetical protein
MSDKQLRLYRETPPMTSPSPLRLRLVPPNAARQAAPVADEVPAVAPAPVAPVAVASQLSLDDQIFSILDQPVPQGVTASYAYREKEQALAAYFTTLSVGDARVLHRRLTIPSPDDALAVRFSRLVADRQARLVAVLADARRREAIFANRRA